MHKLSISPMNRFPETGATESKRMNTKSFQFHLSKVTFIIHTLTSEPNSLYANSLVIFIIFLSADFLGKIYHLVLICVSLVTRKDECFSIYLTTKCIFSLSIYLSV